MSKPFILQLDNVSFTRDHTILNHINWTISSGENWALMGLNGAGKTTLLSLIYGNYWATTGKIRVLGETFGDTNVLKLKKRIGFVSTAMQAQFPENYLSEYIVLSGKLGTIGIHDDFKLSDLEESRQLLITLGGPELIHKPYRLLSQGQRQLVLIARAFISQPELLILDEPCNGLDLFAREHLLQQIRTLAQLPNHPALLFVSHYSEEILPEFQHILLLKSGRIFAKGRREVILTKNTLSQFYPQPVKLVSVSSNRFAVYPLS